MYKHLHYIISNGVDIFHMQLEMKHLYYFGILENISRKEWLQQQLELLKYWKLIESKFYLKLCLLVLRLQFGELGLSSLEVYYWQIKFELELKKSVLLELLTAVQL